MKVTFPLLLFAVLLTLKLTGVIAWSWWWITAPLWFGLAVALIFFAVLGMYAVVTMARG